MCEITKSFLEEGKIIGVVEYLRRRGASDAEIMEEIKKSLDAKQIMVETSHTFAKGYCSLTSCCLALPYKG